MKTRLGCVVTMYKEHSLVLASLKNIRNIYPSSVLIVVHSNDNNQSPELEQVKDLADHYILLPDMSIGLSTKEFRWRVGSKAWGRNFSTGFTHLYDKYSVEHIVAFSGDTCIYDAENILRRTEEMIENDYVCYVSKLLGSNIHAVTDMPEKGIVANRPQDTNSTDFIPNFFIVDGSFGLATKAFSDIAITNELAFEQCIGDELTRALGETPRQKIGVLSKTAYDYTDGIKQQYFG